MIIYKVTNLINGKVYIGQTVATINKRKSNHYSSLKKYVESGKNTSRFKNALLKYKKEDFKWEVIDTADTIEELNKKEVEWIEKTNSFINGYNTIHGGKNRTQSEELKKCISERAKERFSDHRGDNVRKAVSKMQKDKIEKNEHPFCGKFGKEHMHAKKVVHVDKDGTILGRYNGSYEAQRETGDNQSDIIKCCKLTKNKIKGKFWFYDDEKLMSNIKKL